MIGSILYVEKKERKRGKEGEILVVEKTWKVESFHFFVLVANGCMIKIFGTAV